MNRQSHSCHSARHGLIVLVIILFGLGDSLPLLGQNNSEIRSGRIGIEYAKTRYGRKGSQYKSRRNNIMENNSKMGFWSVGLLGGASFNRQERESGYMYDMVFDGGWGGYAGVSATYMFFDWLSIRADVMYSQKNYGMRRMTPELQRLGVRSFYTNHYLQVPVMADWTFGSLVRAHILTGAYGGVWLGGEVSRVTVYDTKPSHSKYAFTPEDNRADGGLVGGVGVSWDPWQFLRIGAEAMVFYSLSNTVKRQAVTYDKRYNTNIVLGVSVRYVF